MKKNLIVGIADYKITEKPNTLTTYALGSCVGIAIYDYKSYLGGLSHILLADSTAFGDDFNKKKYADTAIPEMVTAMVAQGAKAKFLVAKIAGGANMFYRTSKTPFYNIGERNIIAVRNVLKKMNIPIISDDVGGFVSRTLVLNVENLEVYVKYLEGDERIQILI